MRGGLGVAGAVDGFVIDVDQLPRVMLSSWVGQIECEQETCW